MVNGCDMIYHRINCPDNLTTSSYDCKTIKEYVCVLVSMPHGHRTDTDTVSQFV